MDRNLEQQRVAQLRDFSIEEIATSIPIEVAAQLDLHQQSDMRSYNTPRVLWPADIAHIYPEAIYALTNNVALYSDEIESALDQDGLLAEYYELRQHEPNDPQIALAIRARRTILVRLLASSANNSEFYKNLGEVS